MEARSCLVGWAAVMATVPPAIDEHGQRRPEEKSEPPAAETVLFCATSLQGLPYIDFHFEDGPRSGPNTET